jgi:hypothetical protein
MIDACKCNTAAGGSCSKYGNSSGLHRLRFQADWRFTSAAARGSSDESSTLPIAKFTTFGFNNRIIMIQHQQSCVQQQTSHNDDVVGYMFSALKIESIFKSHCLRPK